MVDGKWENELLILHDTFSQEMRVIVEEPKIYFFIFNPQVHFPLHLYIFSLIPLVLHILKYLEQELNQKRGKIGKTNEEIKPLEDDLYVILDHIKVIFHALNCLIFLMLVFIFKQKNNFQNLEKYRLQERNTLVQQYANVVIELSKSMQMMKQNYQRV